jgi:hypothetical protein
VHRLLISGNKKVLLILVIDNIFVNLIEVYVPPAHNGHGCLFFTYSCLFRGDIQTSGSILSSEVSYTLNFSQDKFFLSIFLLSVLGIITFPDITYI